jgi:hypothetical protein
MKSPAKLIFNILRRSKMNKLKVRPTLLLIPHFALKKIIWNFFKSKLHL